MLHIKADMGLAGLQFTKTKYEYKLTVHSLNSHYTSYSIMVLCRHNLVTMPKMLLQKVVVPMADGVEVIIALTSQ
jgi:uncharacterized membrane protein YhfC